MAVSGVFGIRYCRIILRSGIKIVERELKKHQMRIYVQKHSNTPIYEAKKSTIQFCIHRFNQRKTGFSYLIELGFHSPN